MSTPSIAFERVSFRLPGGRALLEDLDLQIQPGETLVLLGRSGSGKTTTMRMINRLLEPTAGQVLVEGTATTRWDPIQLRRRIGYVIQEAGLFPHQTVAENVGLVPRLEKWDAARTAARVDELLAVVGLPPAQYRGRILMLFYLAQPLTTVIGAPLAGWLIQQHEVFFGLEGWRFMFFGVAIPAIVVGVVAWFYLKDKPADAKWLTSDEQVWLTDALDREKAATQKQEHGHVSARFAFKSGRVWVLSFIYFGFIYGLYALAFFLPTIIEGFQEQTGQTFDTLQKGLITAIPYLPAAIVMYFWSRDASRRGLKTWHIAGPAIAGAISIPLALFMGSPAATIAVITITACAIFAALPNFWTLPTRFLTGAAAAAGVALINTIGNLAGFSAPFVTGFVHDWTGGYEIPMFIVGFVMLVSAVLMVLLARSNRINPVTVNETDAAPAVDAEALHTAADPKGDAR